MEMLSRLNEYDRQLFTKVFKQREQHPAIPFARLLSRSGEGVLHVLIPLAVWELQLPTLDELVSLLLLSLVLERSLHWTLKNTLKRPRPQNSIPGLRCLTNASNQFSFPSGHSSRAFLLATVLAVVYGGATSAMYLWAAGVGLSRVLLGVHYPGDVLAGALIGSCTALSSYMLLALI